MPSESETERQGNVSYFCLGYLSAILHLKQLAQTPPNTTAARQAVPAAAPAPPQAFAAGRPPGSKNKLKPEGTPNADGQPKKRGRPPGSKNKPKPDAAAGEGVAAVMAAVPLVLEQQGETSGEAAGDITAPQALVEPAVIIPEPLVAPIPVSTDRVPVAQVVAAPVIVPAVPATAPAAEAPQFPFPAGEVPSSPDQPQKKRRGRPPGSGAKKPKPDESPVPLDPSQVIMKKRGRPPTRPDTIAKRDAEVRAAALAMGLPVPDDGPIDKQHLQALISPPEPVVPKKRGRPPGSKTKPKPDGVSPAGEVPMAVPDQAAVAPPPAQFAAEAVPLPVMQL